ncbi:S9 family peptidase [Halomicrobium sp. IBSBa]|uniref:prolyl oligopeptidase family serine peptidase n=1 Tax=Halomicrobium sp. IBSBa TaxID=2778916 RepID=UPI001ABFBBB6|nr:prolyl oligopeptidase family serine peptidase [Halomicrobium sp. IBSBa]MBO4247609.1 S9 family peptidase [Halomicrobium sp. IBSBa]
MRGPPATERRDSGYEYHGEHIEDPYLWLEDGDDDAVRTWIAAQNQYADDHLSDESIREHLRPRIEDLADFREYHPIQPMPSGYFQRIRDPEQDHPVLYHFEELDQEKRSLVDPNELSDDGTTAVNWYVPAPDGERIAYGVDEDGAEQYDIHVMDVTTGGDIDVVPDAGRTGPQMIAWFDDGFYYVRTGAVGGEGQLEKELRYHPLGSDVEDERVIHDDFDPQTWPILRTSPESDHVVVGFSEGWERTDLYRLPHGASALEPLIEGHDAIFEPELRGTDCYLRTSFGAEQYRLARLDITDPPTVEEPADIETVVPEEQNATLSGFAVTPERLLVTHDRDVVSELAAFDRDGTHLAAVSLPGTGAVDQMHGSPQSDEVFFSYESFEHPKSVMRYDGEYNDVSTVAEPDVGIEADIAVDQEWFESSDGTSVPMFVVRRAGVERDGTNPAILNGYGGFEISMRPEFFRYTVPFIEDGGVLAIPNIRGGGEFGPAWHEAAQRETKQRTFDDFHAAGEHLIERGYADADRLACLGGSNGGLTVGAALTQRPDLFAAVLCKVPLLDMLRFHRSLIGRSWTSEYGNPEEDPEAFSYIREYSPYHNVTSRAYPATLLVTAESDTRVDPFHARKMAARLQACQTGSEPPLLRTYENIGHGVGKPVSQVVSEQLDQWGFLYDRLGVVETSSTV